MSSNAEGAVSAHDRRHQPRHLLDVEAKLKREFARLKCLHFYRGFDNDLKDRLRIGLGDLFDLHAAVARRDHAHPFDLSIEDECEIKFPLVWIGHFDIDALNRFSFATGLSRDEPLAEQRARSFMDFVIGLANFDPTGFAAPTGVNLRLHGPVPAAQFRCGIDGLIRAKCDGAARDRHTEISQ